MCVCVFLDVKALRVCVFVCVWRAAASVLSMRACVERVLVPHHRPAQTVERGGAHLTPTLPPH